jgi:YesN/AraC family two-component response regulator
MLIVDDDKNYRYAIRHIIDWKQYGFRIVGEAINGKQAIEQLKNLDVDLVLTDISMPQMNGVELIKYVKQNNPFIHLIALSAYDEFDFVKESLKCGADDYILKYQLDEQSVMTVIKEVKRKLTEERNSADLAGFIRLNNRSFVGDLLKEALLEKNAGLERINAYLNYRGINSRRVPFNIILIEMEKTVSDQKVEELEGLAEPAPLFCRLEPKSFAVLLTDYGKQNSEASRKQSLMKFTEKMRLSLCGGGSPKIGIGVSNLCHGSPEMNKAYRQAALALGQALSQEDSRTCFYRRPEVSPVERSKELTQNLEDLKKAVEERDSDEILKKTERIFAGSFHSLSDAETLNQLIMNAFLTVHMTAFKMGLVAQPNSEEINSFSTSLKKAGSIDGKKQLLLNDEKKVCMYLSEMPRVMSREIRKVIRYIHTNYKNNITLNEIAKSVDLSANYLSSLFKQETGMHLMEYVNLIRVNRAKVLLRETNLKAYEIAATVGFNNTTYFSSIFKKLTNMTILDYKKANGPV